MASINGVSSGNRTSSLFNSSKTISGLASGLDTEGMIEGLVQGYQSKITSLSHKATKIQWKQDSYRSIISKMSAFSDKYTSYASSTNLMSASFFNNAIRVATQGANAGKVTASGKTSSEIQLNSVTQLAAAARYTTGSSLNMGDGKSIVASEGLDLASDKTLGTLQGTLSLTYGDRVISLSFDEIADQVKGTGAEGKAAALAKAIQEKLKDQKITFSGGETVSASERIEVSVDGGQIKFSDKGSGGNSVYLLAASSTIKNTLGLDLDNVKEDKPATITLTEDTALTKSVNTAEYLSGKSMSLTLDKQTKSIKLPEIIKTGKEESATYQIKDADGKLHDVKKEDLAQSYTDALQASLNKAFGSGKVEVRSSGSDNKLQLRFEVKKEGSDLLINTDVGETLGIGETASTYLDTSKTLGDLVTGMGEETQNFIINGVVVGKFSKDSKLTDVMNAMNSNTDAGVKVSYSRTSKEFVFTASETGLQRDIKMGEGLAQRMFGVVPDEENSRYSKGKDAQFSITVNGKVMENVTRSSNSVEIDGLTLNFKDTFTSDSGKVTFKSSADSDKIVGAVKSRIDDYNAMVTEIKKTYSTLPAQKSNGSTYEPLTEDDISSMSESAIKQYEEKAKQGLLFGDVILSGLYEKFNSILTMSGNDGAMLRKMGITTAYSSSDGVSSLALDESKLRDMLDSDPDSVAEIFTKSTEAGASTNGIMQRMKVQLDNYARLSGAKKGILVERAGTPLSSLSLLSNTYQKELDALNHDIERWQDKLASKVDSYTSQFARLESLINQMNAQSSALAGMMGR
jgi:flagellar hook-associated protein 2